MNKIFALMIAQVNEYRMSFNKNGFTMLDAMMTVCLILAVAVGGYLAYNEVIDNTNNASVESAAASVYAAALAAEADGDSETTSALVQKKFNDSQDAIEVTITISE